MGFRAPPNFSPNIRTTSCREWQGRKLPKIQNPQEDEIFFRKLVGFLPGHALIPLKASFPNPPRPTTTTIPCPYWQLGTPAGRPQCYFLPLTSDLFIHLSPRWGQVGAPGPGFVRLRRAGFSRPAGFPICPWRGRTMGGARFWISARRPTTCPAPEPALRMSRIAVGGVQEQPTKTLHLVPASTIRASLQAVHSPDTHNKPFV